MQPQEGKEKVFSTRLYRDKKTVFDFIASSAFFVHFTKTKKIWARSKLSLCSLRTMTGNGKTPINRLPARYCNRSSTPNICAAKRIAFDKNNLFFAFFRFALLRWFLFFVHLRMENALNRTQAKICVCVQLQLVSFFHVHILLLYFFVRRCAFCYQPHCVTIKSSNWR